MVREREFCVCFSRCLCVLIFFFQDLVGPLQATPTKPGREPVGLDYLRQAAQIATIPHYAIGGVDVQLLPALLEAGGPHCRVAVVRAVMEAADPAAAARQLLELLADG